MGLEWSVYGDPAIQSLAFDQLELTAPVQVCVAGARLSSSVSIRKRREDRLGTAWLTPTLVARDNRETALRYQRRNMIRLLFKKNPKEVFIKKING
jgi:hypothetical protein